MAFWLATRREGQTIWYSMPREDVRALLGYLYETYCATPARRRGARGAARPTAARAA